MTATDPQAILVFCAVPEDFDGEGLAERLVAQSLAACVQMGPTISSTYMWKGALERSRERLLLIKTTRRRFTEVETVIRSMHPYDVPEIVAVPVSDGHAPYLAWITENTKTPES